MELTSYDPRRDVLPILVVTGDEQDPDVKSFMGTGFVLGKDVLVTCHHCVAAPLNEGDRYVVAIPMDYVTILSDTELVGPYGIGELTNISQDPTSLDLVTATAPFSSQLLNLASDGLNLGEDVFTYGYPFTQDSPHPVAGRSIVFNGRYLEGYHTAYYQNDVPGYPMTTTYELDMPAPRGLSGAPVVRRGSSGQVVGVVYGTKDIGTIEEFSRVDEATGKRTPELQRMTTFAVAHHLEALRNLRGPATDGHSLGDYLQS